MKITKFRWLYLLVMHVCFFFLGFLWKERWSYSFRRDVVAVYDGTPILSTEIAPNVDDVDAYLEKWALNLLRKKQISQILPREKLCQLMHMLHFYEASLYMHAYLDQIVESDLIRHLNFSEDELLEYYKCNEILFELGEDIVKYIYIVIPSKFLPQKIFNVNSKEDMDNFCKKYLQLQKEKIIKNEWCCISELINNIPVFKKNKFHGNGFYVVEDKTYSHCFFIYDTRAQGNVAPFVIAREQVVSQMTKDKICDIRSDFENQSKQIFKKNKKLIKYYNNIKA